MFQTTHLQAVAPCRTTQQILAVLAPPATACLDMYTYVYYVLLLHGPSSFSCQRAFGSLHSVGLNPNVSYTTHLSPRHSDNTSRRISFQPMSFSTRRFRFVGIAGPHFYGAYALVCLLKLAQPIHTAPMASSTEVARLFEQKVWYSSIIIPSRKADYPRKAARHKHCCSAFSVGADT